MNGRLVFLTNADPAQVTRLSGTPFYMLRALRAEFGAVDVVRRYKPAWLRKVEWWTLKRTGGRIDLNYSPTINRWLAARVRRRFGGPDAIFLAALCAPMAAALGRRGEAVVNISDATFAAIRSMYPVFQRLSARTARIADSDERDAIRHARLNSFSSRWAARSAVDDYGADPARIAVIDWGCNIDWVDAPSPADADADSCRLLFIGADWQRKGGDLVLDTCAVLARRGFPFVADLVGSVPGDDRPIPAGVTLHGRLDKSDPAQADTLQTLLRRASFLFLPTRQDCTPMVFAEAAAFGAPAITRDVGGVSSVVENGVTGTVLPAAARAEDFADAIVAAWSDRAAYRAMRAAARAAYEQRLNWRVWAARLRQEIATWAPDAVPPAAVPAKSVPA